MKSKRKRSRLTCPTKIGVFSLLFLLLCGCRVRKEVIPLEHADGVVMSKDLLFKSINRQAISYDRLTARLQVELELASGNTIRSRAQLMMVRDQRIQFSFQPFLGIEVMRFELTPDSVVMIDRINKRSLAEGYQQFREEADIVCDFYQLQSLLTNHLFLPDKPSLPADALNYFRWEEVSVGHLLYVEDRTGLLYTFQANESDLLTTTSIHDKAQRYLFRWDYSNFTKVEQRLFPTEVKAFLNMSDGSYHRLSLSFSHLNFDPPHVLPMVVPSHYERITLAQLFNMIGRG